ncbi:MAG: 6-phosphofructokinase [Puniceicoccales bacterium]|jgi:6-phosphofructokinase 1|nr:6-phosphofructokinase [Puniceicoccales bacterium]
MENNEGIEELKGNLLVAQSGGPTVVINSSLAGIVQEALNYECIDEIYGAMHGLRGILGGQFVDLAGESQHVVRGLRHTPGTALGSCRCHMDDSHMGQIFSSFERHNVRYLFYIGGNGSQAAINCINNHAKKIGYPLRAIGVPKTIDNDLVVTDHSPGYGSVVKYVATTVREIAIDDQSMGDYDLVSIVEVMGRDSGWIAAGSMLGRTRGTPFDAPHLIYIPERPFNDSEFLASVKKVLETSRYCLVIVAEGIRNAAGNYVQTSGIKDPLGRTELGGAAEYLQGLVEKCLKIKARTTKLGIAQRAAAHCAALRDNEEAYECGVRAVKYAVGGESGKMVTIIRESDTPYQVSYGLTPLDEIAGKVKEFPQAWIDESGSMISNNFMRYMAPLMQGEVIVPYKGGLPEYVHLAGAEKFAKRRGGEEFLRQ